MLLFLPLAAADWRSETLCFGAGSPVSFSMSGFAGRSGWLTGAGVCFWAFFRAALREERSTLLARRSVGSIFSARRLDRQSVRLGWQRTCRNRQ